ncbi:MULTISPECIES: ABC transporter substrate-binding protein [Virgibacillus]|uniref:ABC transporter substrate-binding protein n=1 Tax=Virgibacillus TaxID=84406 RepID=UPI000388765B|nr:MULTISPECIES: ABC transporter substrate-binding protein [Virgibacillus]EQB37202.1 hypothetical protein M948_09985 [Virgibacillus sp. CM-4]MYL43435.1 ABC transporter substrate-binding protein [Virgibacillus massiliensis]
MKAKLFIFTIVCLLLIVLSACGSSASSDSEESAENNQKNTEASIGNEEEKTVTYLEEEYTVPSETDKIAAASLEAMEDAAMLDVQPIGAITYAGELPSYLAEDLEGAESIGEKTQPNYETLLSMKPDVILGSSKFPADVTEQLNKVATTIPVSHISTNWENNLNLMAELTGKQDEAEKVINGYKEDVEKISSSVESMVDEKVLVIRVRSGNLFVYPQDVYLNPVLYNDLGISVPEEIKSVEAQEMISLEQLAEINPDHIFLQFAEDENADQPNMLEDLKENQIWKSVKAVNEDNVYVNTVDPLAQGGTAWSKTKFLQGVQENLAE